MSDESDRPRRRGKAASKGAVAIDPPAERGLLLRALLYSPKDLVAGLIAFAAVSAIISNALFMQAGRHPSPMFGSTVVMPLSSQPVVNPLPRPRPLDAAARSPALDSSLFENKPVETKPRVEPPAKAASASPRAAAAAPVVVRDPVGDLITSTRRVSAVQRALTEYGYGQLKTTGNIGPETQAAIQKFERERKLPVTGQMSERLVRELSAMTGRPIE
jgi:hypothetical protein